MAPTAVPGSAWGHHRTGQSQGRRGRDRARNRRSQAAGTLGVRQCRRRPLRALREISAVNRLVRRRSHRGDSPHRSGRARNRQGHLRLGDGVLDIRDHGRNRVRQRERSHYWLQCAETGEGDHSGAVRRGNPLRGRGHGDRHPRFVCRASCRHRVGKIHREHGQLRICLLCMKTANLGPRHGHPFRWRSGREPHPRFIRRASCRRRARKADRKRGQLRIRLLCIETPARGGRHEPFGCIRLKRRCSSQRRRSRCQRRQSGKQGRIERAEFLRLFRVAQFEFQVGFPGCDVWRSRRSEHGRSDLRRRTGGTR